MDDQTLQLLISRLDRIENKVDDLSAWKWKIIGAGSLVGIIIGYAVEVFARH